jgi:uncharacterized protein YajQ (UPF0234 family)
LNRVLAISSDKPSIIGEHDSIGNQTQSPSNSLMKNSVENETLKKIMDIFIDKKLKKQGSIALRGSSLKVAPN